MPIPVGGNAAGKGKAENANEVVVSSALDENMVIKKNYERKPDEKKVTVMKKCPKCQQEIPDNEW